MRNQLGKFRHPLRGRFSYHCPHRAPDPFRNLLAEDLGCPASEDTFHVADALYPVADADREFQAVYPLLRRDLAAAGEETTHKTQTPAGAALDRMSIRQWLEARVPGGAASRLGRLLDAAYALEYGAPTTDQSVLNLVYLLGEQPPGGRLSLTGMSDERYRIAGGNDGLPLLALDTIG